MKQILSLRLTPQGKKTDSQHFKNNWRFASLLEMLANPEAVLNQIPQQERWNLFFTINDCTDKKRDFARMTHLPFDLDSIDLARTEEYRDILAAHIKVDKSKIGTICSGNGLQFFVELKSPILDKNYFQQNRIYYKSLAAKIDAELNSRGLSGNVDVSVLDAGRLMRFPNTENRKAHGTTKSYVINAAMEPFDIRLNELIGVPEISSNHQINIKTFKQFFSMDEKAMLSSCGFLKEMSTDPAGFHEPQLYAAFSFLAQMEDKERRALTVARKCTSSPTIMGYTDAEILDKLTQAEMASGPRTCDNINSIWGKCHTCPNFKKINSPISIHGEDFIKTAKTGFHNFVIDPMTGLGKKTTPNFLDLAKFFGLQVGKFVAQNKILYVFKKTHYVEYASDLILNFAQKNFDPAPLTQQCEEFRNLLYRQNPVEDHFWKTTKKKINFPNGILDLETGVLLEHSPSFGFKYCLPYAYDPSAKCVAFEKFLSEVTLGDSTLATNLLEFGGYAVSGDEPWTAKVLILTGGGRNGKSTFLRIVKDLVGRDAYSVLNLSYLKSPERRSALDGKLFNVCDEMPRNLGDSSEIKALAAGDEIAARRLYRDAYYFENYAKLLFSCNSLPTVNDVSFGFFERLLIVPFNNTFVGNKMDPFIYSKLKTELPGILNLFLSAYKNLLKRQKFLESKASILETEQYRKENDSLLSWFEENIELQPVGGESKVFTRTLYNNYEEYFNRSGFKKYELLNFEQFSLRLRKILPEHDSRRFKTNRARGLTGILLKLSHNEDF